MHAAASTPSRSTTSFVVSLGLISIPVSLYSTTVETRVARKEFTKDDHAVGRQPYDKETGEVVDYADVIKKVELADGTLVELTDDEIARATGHTSGVAPIVGYLPMEDVHTQFIATEVYQLRPKRDKKSQSAADRAFALLMTTLDADYKGAVVRVSVRGAIAHWGVICPDGTLRIMHSVDQVREQLPMPKVELSDTEIELAKQLIETIGVVDPDSMLDDNSEKIATFVAEKAKTEGTTPATVSTLITPTSVDVMGQLLASLDAAKSAKSAKSA